MISTKNRIKIRKILSLKGKFLQAKTILKLPQNPEFCRKKVKLKNRQLRGRNLNFGIYQAKNGSIGSGST